MNNYRKRLVNISSKAISFLMVLYGISFFLVIVSLFKSFIETGSIKKSIDPITFVNIILYIKLILVIIMSFNLVMFLKKYKISNEKMQKSLKKISYIGIISGTFDIIYKYSNVAYVNINDGLNLETSFIYFAISFICLLVPSYDK